MFNFSLLIYLINKSMKTKPKIEETLQLPTDDALEQALSYLQNSFSANEVSLKDIKKAVECIDKGEKEPENLLPELNKNLDENSNDSDNTDIEDIINESNHLKEEKSEITEQDIATLLSEINEDNSNNNIDDKFQEKNIEITTVNLPSDSDFDKSMNDTISKSIHAYTQLFDLAINASSGKAVADIANASHAFLRLAFDARQAKLKNRLDIQKTILDERKVKLQEIKAFKDANYSSSNEDISTSTKNINGIKMTPSLREQLINENLPNKNN